MYLFVVASDFGFWTRGPYRNRQSYYTEVQRGASFLSWVESTWLNHDGDIDTLFLAAHGNAGVLNLGPSIDSSNASQLSRISRCFGRGGLIEIHGCAIGSATAIPSNALGATLNGEGTKGKGKGPGYELLKTMSKAAGVRVSAPINSQWGASAAYDYTGSVLTVFPDGKYVYTDLE